MTKRRLTVTDLAAAERCEAQFVFDRRFGKQRSAEWLRRAAKGNRAHIAYQTKVALGARPRDQRCFIASAVFGPDASETEELRAFRDAHLLPSREGRVIVAIYYRLSPPIARMLETTPRLATLARVVLRAVIATIRKHSR